MDILLFLFGAILVVGFLVFLIEFRIRQPDDLVLTERDGKIGLRSGLFFPRHFSLVLKRTPCPIHLDIETSAAGNLLVHIRISGSVAPALDHLPALIRVGGWTVNAVSRASEECQVFMQGLIKEYTERFEISALSSGELLNYLNEKAELIREKFGLDLISLAVHSMDPVDPEIADALRQQEQARLLEQTERLNNQARVASAQARFRADEEIAEMEHALERKRLGLQKALLEEEAELATRRLEEELARNRLRLAYEKEELEVLKSSPELLMLTPQAARLAEASQQLKNARTVISITPQELARASEVLTLFQSLLQKALTQKNEPPS